MTPEFISKEKRTTRPEFAFSADMPDPRRLCPADTLKVAGSGRDALSFAES
jgi:hypothetical protein